MNNTLVVHLCCIVILYTPFCITLADFFLFLWPSRVPYQNLEAETKLEPLIADKLSLFGLFAFFEKVRFLCDVYRSNNIHDLKFF